MRSRVTLDIDGKRETFVLDAVRAYYNLRHAGAERVDVRVSSSGGGLHLIGWFDQSLGHAATQRLREALGDDPERVEMDERRGGVGHPTQVLWTRKGTNTGAADSDFEGVWDAIEHIEASSRSDAARVRAVANEGRLCMTEFHTLNRASKVEGL